MYIKYVILSMEYLLVNDDNYIHKCLIFLDRLDEFKVKESLTTTLMAMKEFLLSGILLLDGYDK